MSMTSLPQHVQITDIVIYYGIILEVVVSGTLGLLRQGDISELGDQKLFTPSDLKRMHGHLQVI